jgi:hypothetical protein
MHNFTLRMFHINYEYVFVFMFIYFSTGGYGVEPSGSENAGNFLTSYRTR